MTLQLYEFIVVYTGIMTKPRTLFISSFFGLIARNILATDVLTRLKSNNDLRIIILAPEEKREFYRQEFGSDNVTIEGVKEYRRPPLDKLLSAVFLNASDTAARRIHRLIERKRDRRYFGFAYHYFLSKIVKIKIIRYFMRWLDYHLTPKVFFAEYFEKYSPDLVFSTDLFEPHDIDLMREAKHRGINTVGMVRSWDNVTSKGLNRIIPDKLIVHSEQIKEEAVTHCDFLPADILVVGIPHYDNYIADKRVGREKLFSELQLDPRKKTIFFAPPSDIYSKNDPISEKAVNALKELDAQLLLRLYIVGNVRLGEIKAIPNKIAIDVPGSGLDFMRADLTSGDAHLADLLYHSDVVVAFASTLAIDAVVFDKPTVFIGFDGTPGRPYWQSLRRFYDYDHQRSILNTGGVKLAKNMKELIRYVEDYLADPSLDREGRKKIIEERCWKLDGRSCERLANAILKHL